MNSVQ